MTAAQHTPGPWHWEEGATALEPYTGGSNRLIAADGSAVLMAFAEYEILCKPEHGRLIAAAPDLLEATKLLLDALTGNQLGCTQFESLKKQARAAIAKATGAAS